MSLSHRIFLAGATGAVGRRLSILLKDAGHMVAGTTRSPRNLEAMRQTGLEPLLVDVFDADALRRAVLDFRPDVVMHQLTDLPYGLPPQKMQEATSRNARLRIEGTRNLVAAATAAGAQRIIAQSIAWAYAPAPGPRSEADVLDLRAQGLRAITVNAVNALERSVMTDFPNEGIVLRYGLLYGPGTGAEEPSGETRLHVDAAAQAAALALDHGRAGPYNVCEPSTSLLTDKVRTELGWDGSFRLTNEQSKRASQLST